MATLTDSQTCFSEARKTTCLWQIIQKIRFQRAILFYGFFMPAASRSMRDALASLKAQCSRLYHWGLKALSRSTISDANRTRFYEFFEDLFREMCLVCANRAPGHQFPFKNKIFSLDSAIIKLAASIFKWAAYRNSKNGVKIHTVLDHGVQKITVRKIGYYDPETLKHYVFLTNNFCMDSKVIADLYKSRWQIEVFFKEIKQFLKIKKFVGTNEKAVKIQIDTALIIYLLLAMQKFFHKIGYSIGQMFQLFQLNLVGLRAIEELLRPKINKRKNSYDYSLLSYLTT